MNIYFIFQAFQANAGQYEKEIVDGSIFVTTMNTLKIYHAITKALLFENKVPQSPRGCRPLSIKYAKETIELISNVNIENLFFR